jgi:hypothetical protein
LSVKAELAHFKKHSPRWIYAINVVTGMWSITHFVKALPRILYEFIYIAHRSSISDFGGKGKAKIEVLSSATGRDIKPSHALKGNIG